MRSKRERKALHTTNLKTTRGRNTKRGITVKEFILKIKNL